MTRKRKMWLFGMLAVVVTTMVVGVGWSEPSYKGRSLTRWLQQCYDSLPEETQKIAQAQLAINAIGAEKALPVLMKMIQAKDGRVRSWVIQKNQKWHIGALKLREGIATRQLGVAGFEALGMNA